MNFDTKIKVILRNDLEPWQELNVTAFLMSGIGATQDIVGEPYEDKNGVCYLPMSQQPIMIHTATGEVLLQLLKKAKERDMAAAIYTQELFTTYNDEDNRASVKQFCTDELHLAGIAIRGKKGPLDRITKDIALHE